VAKINPNDFGPNLTSVTDVRESTRLALRTQCRGNVPLSLVSPTKKN